MSNSRMRLSNRADDDKPHNSSKGKGIILETPYKPGFVDDTDLETVKMAVDKEFSEISNAFYQTIERTADTITRVDKIEIDTDGIGAKIEEVDRVSKEGDEALASRITTISAQVDGNTSSIVTESEARANADEVITKRVDTILGSMQGDLGPLVGQFQEQIRVLGDTDGVLADRITTIEAEYKTADGDIRASISTEEGARVAADTALAGQITTVKSELEGQVAEVRQFASTEVSKVEGEVNKINAKWGVELDVNGKISGVIMNNDGSRSDFAIRADRFTVSDGTTNYIPLVVEGGTVKLHYPRIYGNMVSDNWDGNNGWAITPDGWAQFGNVTVRGTVHASTFTGVGAISSVAGGQYSGNQGGTTEIEIGASGVTNTSAEVVQCIVEVFNVELYGHCEVAIRARNRTTGAYNTRYVKSILPDGQMTPVSCAVAVDVAANASNTIQVTVQKTGGTGYWTSPDGHIVRGLHRKYS